MSAVVTPLKPPVLVEQPPAIEANKPRRGRLASMFLFAAREPFFQFLVLGALIWLVAEYVEAHNQRYIIHVGPAERQRLAISYLQQYNQAPTPEQLQQLTENYIRQQIFVREGRALGLDTNDEIVDRRIAQKFEFIQQDLGVPDDPSSEAIKRWYDTHRLNYLTQAQVAFTQIYFSMDNDGEQAARDRAAHALASLRASDVKRAPQLGDAFPGPTDPGALTPDQAGRVFGESDFSRALFKLPVGRWSGPLRSGYGWHLVYVTGHVPPRLPPLAQVRDRVAQDWRDEQRRLLNAQAYENLRAKYTIAYDRD